MSSQVIAPAVVLYLQVLSSFSTLEITIYLTTCRVSPYRVVCCHSFGIASVPPADVGSVQITWHVDKDPYNVPKHCQVFHAAFRWLWQNSTRMLDGAVQGHKTQITCEGEQDTIHLNDYGRSGGNLKSCKVYPVEKKNPYTTLDGS